MPDFLTLPSQSGYDPTTRPGLFGRQPGYVPYEPPNPDEEMFGRDTIYKERLAEQQKKAQENARLQRQAALDQHLRQYEDDPLAKLFGEAEFDRLEEDTARKASQKRLDDIQAEYDDPVEKILAVGRAMKLQGQQPVRQRQAEAEAIEQMRAADADQRAIEQTLPKNAFIREAAVGSAAASQTMASRLARMLGQGEAADELNRQVNTLNQGAAQARDKDWSPYLSRQFGGAVQSLIGTASTPGGPMLKIGGAAFDAGNQALTTAEDAGLTGTARLRYAGTQALLEGGVAAVFQKMGLGGAESRMAGQAVAAQTWKQLAKNLGKDALQEVPEEVMTAVLQDVSSKLEGVTPDAGFGDMVSNATDAAVQALLMSGLTNTPNAARLFIQRPSRENYKALPPEMKLPGKPENYVPPGDQRKAMAEQMRQGPAVQPSEPSATTGVTPEEQAAIDEENRLTAMKSPGAQPDFVPPPDPDAQPRGEVIQNQGQNAPVPPVSPRSETAVPSETKAPAIDFSQLTEEEVHQWLTELQGGPATEPQNPVQGGSHELQDEEKQRREGQQGLLTPDEPRSMNMARQQSQQWLRTNPEPTPPSPRYDGRALQSLAPSDPGSSPGAAVEAQGPVDQKAFQGTRKAGGFSGAASAGLGTQFATDSNEYASQYGDVTEVPVQFSNPYYMPLGEFRKYDRGPEASVKRSQQRAQELVASGHDGIVVTHHDGVREFITLPQRTNSAIAAMDEAGPEQREPSNPGVDAPATAVTDEQALKDSALPDENTPQDKVQELARIASERGWSVKTMKEKAIEAGVAPGAVRMAAAKMAQERQRAGTQQSPTPTVEEMRSNQQANPSVQELVDQLEAEANRLGLKFSTHTADTGSRYFSAGVPNPDGNWNDQIKVRVGDHGARFGSLRDVQLTTLQSPVDLQAGLEKAIQKLRNLQPATPAVSLPAGPSQGREVQQPDSSPTLLGEVSESAASPAPASGIEKARSAKREKDYTAAREQFAPQVAEGWTTGTAEVDDVPARKKMEKERDRLLNEWDSISPDTPNGKRLKELNEQLKNPVTKPVYFMAHPNGRNRKSLTKTQYEALTQGPQPDTQTQPTGPAPSSPTATAPQGDEQGPVGGGSTLEPWQMDRRQYNKSRQGTPVDKTSGMGRADSITADHRAAVRKAFVQGQDVPWLALEPYLDDFKREGQGQRLAERVQSDVEQGRDVPEAALKRYPPKPSKPAAKAPWQDRLDQIKRENGDALVLFRMGDFYEMFGDDAKKAAATLGLTLTTRDKSSDNPIPMAGFPYHALEGYLHKLVKSGHRVAVAEDPTGKKDAKRNITVQEPAKTPEVAAPVAALPTVSESQPTSPGAKHHIAIYGDKEVPVVSDKKREFMVAAQRVRDNLGTGEVGYVKTPDGKTFKITTDSKLAKPVDSVPEQTSPPSVAAKPETVVEKSASDVSAVSIQKGQRQKGLAGLEDVAAETESKESLALDNVANRNFLTGFGGREFADSHQTALRRLPGKIKARLAETGEVSEEEIQSWLLRDLPKHLEHKEDEYDDWTKEVTIDAMNAASDGPLTTVTVPSGRKGKMETWSVGQRVKEGDDYGTITSVAKEVVDGSIVTFPMVQFDGEKTPDERQFSDLMWVDPDEEELTKRLNQRDSLEDDWSLVKNPSRTLVDEELTERVKTYFSPVDYENAGLEGKTGIDLLDSASTFAGDNKRLKLTSLQRELKALEDWYYDALPSEEAPVPATVEPVAPKEPWQMTREDWVEHRLDNMTENEGRSYKTSSGKWHNGRDQVRNEAEGEWFAKNEEAAVAGKPVVTKPAWMLTQAEEDEQIGNGAEEHRMDVERAVKLGFPVPEKVLAEYPDLQKPKIDGNTQDDINYYRPLIDRNIGKQIVAGKPVLHKQWQEVVNLVYGLNQQAQEELLKHVKETAPEVFQYAVDNSKQVGIKLSNAFKKVQGSQQPTPAPASPYQYDINEKVKEGNVEQLLKDIGMMPFERAKAAAMDAGIPAGTTKTRKALVELVRRYAEANTPEKVAERVRRNKIDTANSEAKRVIENAHANRQKLLGAPIESDLTDDQFKNPHSDENRAAVQAAWAKQVKAAVDQLDKTDPTAKALAEKAKTIGLLPETAETSTNEPWFEESTGTTKPSDPLEVAVREASERVGSMPNTTVAEQQAVNAAIKEIAERYGVSPDDVYHDVMWRPGNTGMPEESEAPKTDQKAFEPATTSITVDDNSNIILSKVPDSLSSHLATRLKEWWNEGRSFARLSDDRQRLVDRLNEQDTLREPDVDVGDLDERYSEANSAWNRASSDKYQTKNAYDVYLGNEKSNLADKLGVPKQSRAKKWDSLWRQAEASAKETVEAKRLSREMKDADAAEAAAMKVRDETRREREKRTASALRRQLGAVPSGTVLISGTNSNLAIRVGAWNEQQGWYDAETGSTTLDGRFVSQGTTRLSPWQLHAGYVTAQQDADLNELREQVVKAEDLAKEKRKQIGERAAAERRAAIRQQNWTADTVKVTPAGMTPKGTKLYYVNVGDVVAVSDGHWMVHPGVMPKELVNRTETIGFMNSKDNPFDMKETAKAIAKGAVPLRFLGREIDGEGGGIAYLTDGKNVVGVDQEYYSYFADRGFEFRANKTTMLKNGEALKHGSRPSDAVAMFKDGAAVGMLMPRGDDVTLLSDFLGSLTPEQKSAARGPEASAPTLKEKAAKATQEMKDAAQAFKKSIGGTTPNIGSFSPEALQAFTKLTVKAINAGALNFADYVATLSAELGDMAESLRPLMAQMWPKIAARQGLDPSTEEAPKPEKVEASGPTLFGEQGPPVEPPVDDAETPDDAGGVPNPTATKHADSDATREAMGMPPRKIHDPEGHSFEDLWERARKAPSQEIDELIAELADNPRTLDGRGYENALLLRRATELNNQYKKAVREKQEARDAGDSVKVVERDKAKQMAIEQRRMLADILDELGSRAGSELNARKMMMNDDYSVAHMEMEYADEHDGEAPSDAQVEEWAKWEQQVKDLQEQVTQERAGREAAEQALALEKAHSAAHDRAEADKKSKEKSSVIQKGIERGRKHLEDGFKMLGQMRGKVYSIEGAAVDLSKALTEIVRGYAEIGVFSFADAMKRFAQRVGTEAESMRSDFKQAWDAHFAENGVGELQDRIDPENPQSIGAIAKRLHQFVIERDNLGKTAEDRDRAVAGVHELLGEAMDDLTLEQTARILSGKDEPTRKLSEEEIRTEHRAQLQLLEDIQSWKNNERPNAIQERRPDSDEQRKLRRIRAEAKKNAKVEDVRDPAQQLQSALDSAKTSTKNRISDLNEAIRTGQRIMASKTVLIPDSELTLLRAERDALQAAYDEAFGKKEMSDEQRAAMLEKALDRQIAQLEADIPKGVLYPPAMQPKLPITNPAIAAKKAQRDALVARRDELRLLSPETAQRELEAREKALTAKWEKLKGEREAGKLWNDKEHKAKPTNERIAALEEAIGLSLSERDYDRKNSPEYQAREMAYYERVLAGRVQFWQNRINEGDFAPKAPKEPRKLTESQMTLQHELEKAKDKFANEQEKWRIENRTATQKVKDFAGHAWDFWRDIKSTGELSPFGRQGLMYVAGHWLRAGKAIAESIGTAFATDPEHALSRINQKILDRPNAKAGLYKDVPFATKLNDRTSQQEVMIGEWAKRIPLFGSMVKRFGTAGEAFLNIARADMMDSMLATLGVEPNRVSKDEAKFLANAAGVLTGRGNLDPGTAKVLNRVLYSSLFTMSRIETVIGRPLWKQGGSARARMAIAKEYVRSAVGLYLMDMALKTALMALPGDDEEDEVTIETNTTSTDFGKLKAGRTRIDTMGGLQQTLVLLERLRQGQKTKSGVVEILGSTFGGDDENDLLSKFARSRLHPTLAMVWDRWTGENAVGEKTRPLTDYDPRTSAGLKNIALENGPMAYGDMLAAADELGYPRGLLAATAAFFGSGLSTYGNTKAEDQRFLTLKATGTLTTEDKVKATKGAMQGYTAAEFVKQGVPKAQQALKNARTPEQKRLAEKALRDAQTATESALAADVTIQSARKELLKIKSWDEKVKLYSQAYKERNGSIASPAFIEGVKRLPHANGPRKISPALRSELLQALNEKYPKRFNKDRTINQEWRKLKLAIEAM